MKKLAILFVSAVILLSGAVFLSPAPAYALDSMTYYDITRNAITPIPCGTSEARSCPKEMAPIYEKLGEPCATSFEEFSKFPTTRHFWIEDPAITAQGKANERARQFIYWSVNHRAIDDHPVLREIWGTTSSIAFFFVVIVAAVFGLGFIISKRTSFNLNMDLWPTLIKIATMLIYIALSASIVLLLIQISEILMRFFIDNLGGKDLFNIYFSNTGSLGSSERNYTDFVGCRDLNIRVQESVDAKIFLYKLTNITYYIMGTMIILRKILLWFLMFVAPFLAILMPFVFVRNIGWIWIGVFFQWLFYGPLFALFLGALSKIWKAGIPFNFDFSRVVPTDQFASARNGLVGYTYPTAMNILYGGPAQINSRKLSALNSGSYVDTFTEYVITLIMLWAVTFFPWWLLRIFRDYCCDGIYAMKNVLFEMYTEMREANNPTKKGPQPTPKFDLKQVLKVPTETKIDNKINAKIASMESIRTSTTADIAKSLDMKVTRLTDIARMETNRQSASAMQKNMALLANPAQAQTSAERQQFMNLRTELFNRAIKQDAIARTMLSSTSSSSYEKTKIREELVRNISNTVMNTTAGAARTAMMSDLSRGSSAGVTVSLSKESISQIAKIADMSAEETSKVVTALAKTNTASLNKAVSMLSKELNMSSEKLRTAIQATMTHQVEKTNRIMTTYMDRISNSQKAVETIAKRSGVSANQVREIISAYVHSMDKPANQVIPNITVVAKVEESKAKSVLMNASAMFMAKNIITDFADANQMEEQKVETAVTNVAKATGASGGDTPDVGGPQGGPPTQPTKTEAELQAAAAAGTAAKTAEAGADQGIGGGPAPAPTMEERKIAAQVAEKAMEHEEILAQAGVTEEVKASEKPAVVRTVVRVVRENVEAANEIAQEVAKTEDVKVEEAAKIVQEQLEVAAKPEENIEKIVAVPPSVSIEEYEELKEMWAHQYEEGEIPVQENIQTREEWVEADIVTITNVMNKILSPNEDLQQQGLDELGFIIPIFMLNNLKGEQLVTYLKAKLEAAKATKKILDREAALRAKLEKEKAGEEEFVELEEKKKEEPKLMHMELDEDKGPTTIEERAQVEVQAAPEVNKAYEDLNQNRDQYGADINPAYNQDKTGTERSWNDDAPSDGPKEYGADEPALKEYGAEDANGPKEYGAEEDKKKEW